MSYFAIREAGTDFCICREDRIEDVQAALVLGEGNWEVREISEVEYNQFEQAWFDWSKS